MEILETKRFIPKRFELAESQIIIEWGACELA